jgi:Spy/CpxP family protein refolding chaperone
MKKLGLLLCAVLTLGIFTSCNRSPEEKVEYMVKKVEKKLDLTAEQSKQFNAIAQKGLKRFKESKNDRQDFFVKAKELILSENISEAQARELMQKRKDKKEEIINELLPEILDFHQTLSPEQKKKVVKFMDKIHRKCNKHWNK